MAFDVRIAPTQVQGRVAPRVVASTIRRFRPEAFDIVVVVRGGGSKADLATFDAETRGQGHRRFRSSGVDGYRRHR